MIIFLPLGARVMGAVFCAWVVHRAKSDGFYLMEREKEKTGWGVWETN